MAIVKGYNGSITAGGGSVGEVKNFSLDQSSDVVEVTTLGSAWAKNASTIKRWSGSLTAHFDIGDTGQDALRTGLSSGSVVALVLSLGDGTTYAGDAVVESISIANDVAGIVEASVSFTGSDSLTETPSA